MAGVPANPVFGAADLVLLLGVTGMAVGMAYVRSPRAKSLVYMLPVPFSLALVTTGKGVDATHAIAFFAVCLFVWLVWFLHARLKLNIILADVTAIACYCAFGLAMTRVVPSSGDRALPWFATALAVIALGGAAAMILPHREEPGHRSRMSPAIKAPLVILVVAALVLAKRPLRGFMPGFPIATIFAVYESRRSLYTLARRFPIFLLGVVPMIVVLRVLLPEQEPIAVREYVVALAGGWAVYLPIYLALDALDVRRRMTST